MSRNQTTVTCQRGEWTEITNGDVEKITFQVLINDTYIRYTTDGTAPTEAGGLIYVPNEGALQQDLSTLTALTGAKRVWGKPATDSNSLVYVDHA